MSKFEILESIDTEKQGAHHVGEMLRDHLFVEDENNSFVPQYGCYETFMVRGDAIWLDEQYAENLFNIYSGWSEPQTEVTGYKFMAGNIPIQAVWKWDGDGCLIFVGPDFCVVNNDCKKDSWYYTKTEGEYK